MNGHNTIIATGPVSIRRLCCGTSTVDSEASEMLHAALDAVDDQVALLDGLPVAVDLLWRNGLQSLDCRKADARKIIQVVHPSWWPSSRVDVITAAAATLSDSVEVRPRSWLLRRVSNATQETVVVVEIAERLVSVNGGEGVAVARNGESASVAEEVAGLIREIVDGATTTVVLDVPGAVGGAQSLATSIAAALRGSGQRIVRIDDARLSRLARSFRGRNEVLREQSRVDARPVRSRVRMLGGLAAATVLLAATAPAIVAGGHRGVAPVPVNAAPTTFLVEGRIALTVPANWPTQRVVAGPGSARVQVTSPSDPEVALHITQSPIPDESLGATADRLRHAIDTEPAGVFVDFNPSGVTAGRAAVTYREVRATHHVLWTVLVDGTVRISIGCQSRPGGEDAVHDACDGAVRSAHAIA